MRQQEDSFFHPITLEDQEWMKQKMKVEDAQACEYTFANNFIWRRIYQVEVAEIAGCGVIRFREDGQYRYSFPFGDGDKRAAVSCLKKLCREKQTPLDMSPLVEAQREWLLQEFPGEFELEAQRSDFDYIYTTEKLSTLKGKKLHGKRNHIARFKDDDDWSYEEMMTEKKAECREMARRWIALRKEKWNDEMEAEMQVLEEAFSHMEELSLVGGILRKAGEIVAFSIGEHLNSNTFVVHFEKAYPSLQGAYPMINQQFVLHECQGYSYVNREEDTGDLGLRKAKLSYYPDILLKKYRARESAVVYASEYDREAVQQLWQTCFGDEEEYVNLYLEQRFTEDNMMVIFADGKPVSMASFLPVEVLLDGERIPARYVYAVATLPDYRRRGYAAQILMHAAEKYRQPLILQPAEEKLKDYYRGLGFCDSFKEWHWARETAPMTEAKAPSTGTLAAAEKISVPEEIAGWSLQLITPQEYVSIRDAAFSGEGYVRWDEEAVRYAIYENNFCGGMAFQLEPCEDEERIVTPGYEARSKNGAELLLCRLEEEALRIIECTLEPTEWETFLPAFAAELGKKSVFYENAGGMMRVPERSCVGKKGYLGLTME